MAKKKSSVKKANVKKPIKKKATAKATKKSVPAKKATNKKTVSKKKAVKKPVTKKAASKKTSAKKTVAKKKAVKKTVAKKAPAKKVVSKKIPIKKAAAPKKVEKKKAAKKIATVKPKAQDTMMKKLDLSDFVTPLDDRLLVQLSGTERMTAGGLYIPDTVSDTSGNLQGYVVAVGRGHVNKKGHLRPMDVQVGDKVVFSEYSGSKIKFQNEDLIILREADVMGVVAK